MFYSHTDSRNTQKRLHVSSRIYTEKFSRKGAKGAERYVLLFLCQNKIFTHRNTEFWSVSFRESLRRLRETIPLRMVHYYLLLPHYSLIQFRMALLTTHYSLLTDIAPHGISENSCPFVARKNTCRYAPIRGDFSVDSVDSV